MLHIRIYKNEARKLILLIVIIILIILLGYFVVHNKDGHTTKPLKKEKTDLMDTTILEAIDEASEWLEIDGVEGIGEGKKDNQPCLIVYLSKRTSKIDSLIPNSFKGFPVIMEDSGTISAE